MQIDFTKHFSKQIDRLYDGVLREKLRKIVSMVMAASTSSDISNLKKLKGHPSAYRIRLGYYRIGLFIEDDSVIFAAFEHRKNIYNKFL
jgi:mRNA interferase RelE/StbE